MGPGQGRPYKTHGISIVGTKNYISVGGPRHIFQWISSNSVHPHEPACWEDLKASGLNRDATWEEFLIGVQHHNKNGWTLIWYEE